MKQIIAKSLLSFALGFIAGICAWYIFSTPSDPIPVVRVEAPEKAVNQIFETEQRFQKKLDSLHVANNSLQERIEKSKNALRQTKHRQKAQERKVIELAASLPAPSDSLSVISNCDSLSQAALQVIKIYGATDSIQTLLIEDLQHQVYNRDSTIRLQNDQYAILRAAFDTAVFQQRELLKWNEKYRRQLKNEKRGKKLLSALLCIGAGFAALRLAR